MFKKVFVLFTALIMVIAIVGCGMVTVNEDRDGRQVVATVNGVDILKSAITSQTKIYLAQSGYTEGSEEYKAYYLQVSEGLLESMITYELLKQKCAEFGIEEITSEQQSELDSMLELYKTTVRNNVESQYPEDNYDTEEEWKSVVDKVTEEKCIAAGYINGEFETQYKLSYIRKNVTDYLCKDYDPTDDEIQKYYDQQVIDQKSVLDDLKSSITTYETDGTLVYVPEGMRYVRNLLIAVPDDIKTAIDDLRANDDDEGADTLRDNELEKIKDKADEAYAAAQEDFTAALEKYGEDPGMTEDPGKTEGYRIYSGNATYDKLFVDAGMALEKIGDVSEPVGSDFGYYIIEYTSEMEAGVKPLEEVKDSLKEYLVTKNEEESLNVSLGEWIDASTIERFTDRLV